MSGALLFVVMLRYVRPLTEVDRWLEQHLTFLESGYADGHFLLSGPQQPRTGGVILARAADQDTLLALLAEDPFWREGVATYEVTAFMPAKASPALQNLIPVV